MPWVYILHFDEHLAHANHYAGSTVNLRRRLYKHANGQGSALTRYLHSIGLHWQLGGLYQANIDNARRAERMLKDQHNAARYCEICNQPKKIPGTIQYERLATGIPTKSQQIARGPINPQPTIELAFTTLNDTERAMKAIKNLMKTEKNALGFIPAGGEAGMNTLVPNGKILLATAADQVVGYTAFTTNAKKDTVNIHQCCVADEYRLENLGRNMVQLIAHQWHDADQVVAKVRDDLPANLFWTAIGFRKEKTLTHKTSGSTIHHYKRTQTPIFPKE